MRTGNPVDGMYLYFLIVPFMLSLWYGDIIRKKLESYLTIQSNCNHTLSSFAGIVVEAMILILRGLSGLLLIILF
jgi:hypothetical protein